MTAPPKPAAPRVCWNCRHRSNGGDGLFCYRLDVELSASALGADDCPEFALRDPNTGRATEEKEAGFKKPPSTVPGAMSGSGEGCDGRGALSFDDALRIARGCTDYGGGYRGNAGLFEAYQGGIATVIAALSDAKDRGLADTQVAALHRMGKEPL